MAGDAEGLGSAEAGGVEFSDAVASVVDPDISASSLDDGVVVVVVVVVEVVEGGLEEVRGNES